MPVIDPQGGAPTPTTPVEPPVQPSGGQPQGEVTPTPEQQMSLAFTPEQVKILQANGINTIEDAWMLINEGATSVQARMKAAHDEKMRQQAEAAKTLKGRKAVKAQEKLAKKLANTPLAPYAEDLADFINDYVWDEEEGFANDVIDFTDKRVEETLTAKQKKAQDEYANRQRQQQAFWADKEHEELANDPKARAQVVKLVDEGGMQAKAAYYKVLQAKYKAEAEALKQGANRRPSNPWTEPTQQMIDEPIPDHFEKSPVANRLTELAKKRPGERGTTAYSEAFSGGATAWADE